MRPGVLAFALSFADGAVLASLADTLMPEAVEHGRPLNAFSTTLGFLLAFVLSDLLAAVSRPLSTARQRTGDPGRSAERYRMTFADSSGLALRLRECGMDEGDEVLSTLIERCRGDHHAWVNGDASGYDLADGGIVLGAFGGAAAGPVLDGGRSGDVARLVMIERATVQFRQRGGSHRWELRVTEVFRRRGEQWLRIHRHADPLVERRGLDDVLDLIGR